MLTEIFLSFMVSSAIGLIVICVRLLYKSKCSLFQLACLRIERAVEIEQHEHDDVIVNLARRLSIAEPPAPAPPPPITTQPPIPHQHEEIIRYENIYNLPKRSLVNDFSSNSNREEVRTNSSRILSCQKSTIQPITPSDIESGISVVQSVVDTVTGCSQCGVIAGSS